jgi:hypothetical protein
MLTMLTGSGNRQFEALAELGSTKRAAQFRRAPVARLAARPSLHPQFVAVAFDSMWYPGASSGTVSRRPLVRLGRTDLGGLDRPFVGWTDRRKRFGHEDSSPQRVKPRRISDRCERERRYVPSCSPVTHVYSARRCCHESYLRMPSGVRMRSYERCPELPLRVCAGPTPRRELGNDIRAGRRFERAGSRRSVASPERGAGNAHDLRSSSCLPRPRSWKRPGSTIPSQARTRSPARKETSAGSSGWLAERDPSRSPLLDDRHGRSRRRRRGGARGPTCTLSVVE